MKLNSIICLLLLVSCTHSIHQVHLSGHAPYSNKKTGKLIQGYGEQKAILGFVTDTDYVEQARADLMSKCQDGDIKGIYSTFSTSHGFLHWTNKVRMRAVCLRE